MTDKDMENVIFATGAKGVCVCVCVCVLVCAR
jgi:hypothetical protein